MFTWILFFFAEIYIIVSHAFCMLYPSFHLDRLVKELNPQISAVFIRLYKKNNQQNHTFFLFVPTKIT